MSDSEAAKVGLAITTNQNKWAGVGEGRKILLTEMGIEFVGDMEFDQWRDLVLALQRFKNSWDLCAATAVRYGIKKFGRTKVEETLTQCEFDHICASRSLQLAQMELNFSEYAGLTSEHFFVLSLAFPDKEQSSEAVKWANLARKHKMSPVLLKRSIEAGKVLDAEDAANASGKGSGGLGFLDGLGFAFNQWQRRIGGKQAILSLDTNSKRRWLDSVKDVVELVKEVEESLS